MEMKIITELFFLGIQVQSSKIRIDLDVLQLKVLKLHQEAMSTFLSTPSSSCFSNLYILLKKETILTPEPPLVF